MPKVKRFNKQTGKTELVEQTPEEIATQKQQIGAGQAFVSAEEKAKSKGATKKEAVAIAEQAGIETNKETGEKTATSFIPVTMKQSQEAIAEAEKKRKEGVEGITTTLNEPPPQPISTQPIEQTQSIVEALIHGPQMAEGTQLLAGSVGMGGGAAGLISKIAAGKATKGIIITGLIGTAYASYSGSRKEQASQAAAELKSSRDIITEAIGYFATGELPEEELFKIIKNELSDINKIEQAMKTLTGEKSEYLMKSGGKSVLTDIIEFREEMNKITIPTLKRKLGIVSGVGR